MSDREDQRLADRRSDTDAIRQVLDAEAAVKRKVEACRSSIAEALAEEQARARRIDHRTSERLSRLHASCDQRMEDQAASIRASATLAPVQPDAAARQRLEIAVNALAARITGAADG